MFKEMYFLHQQFNIQIMLEYKSPGQGFDYYTEEFNELIYSVQSDDD